MKKFTAKQLHDNPGEVFRAAVQEPVKITHRNHGELILMLKGFDVSSYIDIGIGSDGMEEWRIDEKGA